MGHFCGIFSERGQRNGGGGEGVWGADSAGYGMGGGVRIGQGMGWGGGGGVSCLQERVLSLDLKQSSDSAVTTFWGRLFQSGMVLGKNDICVYCVQ